MSHLDAPSGATRHGYYHAATDQQHGDSQLGARAKAIWLTHANGSGRDWARVPPGPEDGVLVYVTNDGASPKQRLVLQPVDAAGKPKGKVEVAEGTTAI